MTSYKVIDCSTDYWTLDRPTTSLPGIYHHRHPILTETGLLNIGDLTGHQRQWRPIVSVYAATALPSNRHSYVQRSSLGIKMTSRSPLTYIHRPIPYSRFSSIGFFPFFSCERVAAETPSVYSQWVSHFYSFLADS